MRSKVPVPALDSFHPAVRTWFQRRFGAPTDAQRDGWPEIFAGRDTLISAPTGSGKTLAAFLVSIDRLMKQAEHEPLPDEVQVVYVSPLKALSSDIRRNLEEPLQGIAEVAGEMGLPDHNIRTAVRTGDTTPAERQQIVKRPPHILITTPESLYLMVTAEKSREILRNVKTVIVDEIHALIRDKRGSHLSLTLARLDHICTSNAPLPHEAGSTSSPLSREVGSTSSPLSREVGEGLGVRATRAVRARPSRVGLSATIKPIEDAARFLVGADRVLPNANSPLTTRHSPPATRHSPLTTHHSTPDCSIVNSGHQRDLELTIEVPPTEIQAVASGDQWKDVYDRLAELIKEHRTTLVFVNTRRLSEKVAYALSERLGEEHVGSHHGSLSKERRLGLERRLKAGEMKALVATASLELGIDIGTVDLVCQLESPRSITTFLQRVGRSGHALGLTPRGALFPLTRDELVECAALVRAVRAGRLDRVNQPVAPLDILAQQLVAEVACEDWAEDDLYALVRNAAPYSGLSREHFDEVVELMSDGIKVGSGTVASYIHRDRINSILRGRRGARSTAIQCGGAIPEIADYRVIADPEGTFVGTLDEDFSIESMAGDIILLGTTSWRIRRIESNGTVRVEDAHGAPPTVPFWLGEAPGRTLELSEEVSKLRTAIAERLPGPPDPRGSGSSTNDGLDYLSERNGDSGTNPARQLSLTGTTDASGSGTDNLLAWLESECGLPPVAGEQVASYIRAEKEMLGVIPTQQDIVFERFFDESGGQQLVVHAPFGARINRAWGLALRKRFCVGFDFELQAAANDDAMLLSIGPNNSFPLEAMFDLVKPNNVQESVEQALLVANAPMWGARWRWNATRALAILRQRQGKRVPPPIQRMKADDLMAAVFPVLVACQENLTGPIKLPDHPLTRQTMTDCLNEAMDIDGLKDVLERVERGEIQYHSKDTTEPSPMAHEILNSKPYTFLDDAPLEERRARAVTLRRSLPASARDLGVLDEDAIERVCDEAWPDPRDAEELHDVLLGFIALRPQDARTGAPVGANPEWHPLFDELADQRRAAIADTADGPMWFAAENLRLIEKLYPGATIRPEIRLPAALDGEADEDAGRLALARGHIECLGPVTPAELAARTGLSVTAMNSLLAQLEGEGSIIRGHFRPHGRPSGRPDSLRSPGSQPEEQEWCDRRLLARIHRLTLDRLRQEIEPVSIQDLTRFLLRWQHVAPGTQYEGKRGLLEAVTQLQGFDIPAVAWERHILPARVAAYKGSWLDDLCFSGDITWARLGRRKTNTPAHLEVSKGPRLTQANSATPISLTRRADLRWLIAGIRPALPTAPSPSRGSGFNLTGAGVGQPPITESTSGEQTNSDIPEAGAGRDILDLLQARGALFYDDIVEGSRRLPTDVERGLWDLVARGLVTADGFQALRSLMASTRKRNFRRPQRARLFRTLTTAGTPSGRWSLLPLAAGVGQGFTLTEPTADAPNQTETPRSAHPEVSKDERRHDLSDRENTEALAEAWAEQLLFRYGVVFRDLTQRESFSVPWREILRVLRRMEAQGLVRGGRFVAGVYGEQYARPEAVEALRKARRTEKKGEIVRLSAVDPLNIVGTVIPVARPDGRPSGRITAIHTNTVVYRDGLPIASAEVAQEPIRLAAGR